MYEILIAILGSGLLSTLITNLFSTHKDKTNKNTGITKALRALLYDKIKYLCKKHIANGFITFEDYEDLVALHKIYHDDLCGNGYLDNLMQQTGNLNMIPHKPE